MGQITTTQNLVAIKEVRHAGQSRSLSRHSREGLSETLLNELTTSVKRSRGRPNCSEFEKLDNKAVFPLTHNRCEVVISWWSPLLPKISIYATKCESILEKSGIFIHLQSKYCINLSCKKNLTSSWVQIAARW